MENNNTRGRFYWIYLVGFLVISSLPLWAVPPLLHPAPWGKTIIFRIILSILIFCFVYQISYRKDLNIFRKLGPKPVKTTMGILAALGSLFFLSTIFSQDVAFSFWGSPWRGGGFLNFLFYIILAIFTFLVLKGRDWKKIWDFSILIGALVALFGACQYFNFFPGLIVAADSGVASTMGNSSQLAIYLSFLFFLALSRGLEEKSMPKRMFYFASMALFAFGIFISGARSTYLSIIIGLFFFFFFYPKRIIKLKIITGGFILFSILAVYYLNTFPTPPDFIKSNATANRIFSYLSVRTSLKQVVIDLTETRSSTWQVGLRAIKEKPIFGWGPENFSIGFDKNYDPSLPQLSTLWWDRAHNFLVEYATTGGVPFMIAYLLLVGYLLWQLQRLKNSLKKEGAGMTQPIITHGLQAALISYLISVFFTFDSFDTYLIFFLATGYCLYLFSSSLEGQNNSQLAPSLLYKWRKFFIFFVFVVLIFFIWLGNLKPLLINKELNWSEYYSINHQCQKAIDKMEKVFSSPSIIGQYVMLQYSDVLKDCQIDNAKQEATFIGKSIQVLEEAAKLRPTYTRTWILLGSYYGRAVTNNPEMKTEEKEAFLSRADDCFKKASELSPRRQEVFMGWADIYMLGGDYDKAKEKAEECIAANDTFGDCYWQKALTNVLLGELEESNENVKKAHQYEFDTESQKNLSKLVNAYLELIKNTPEINLEYYRGLADTYEQILPLQWENFQYHASLAYVYKILGEYKKAREQAMFVIKFSPESEANVTEFLDTLPY